MIAHLESGSGSLATLIPEYSLRVPPADRRLLQELCFGLCRHAQWLAYQVDQRLQKPLRAKDRDVHLLMQLGIYQLAFMQIAPHAAVNLTVATTKELGKTWARGLTNAMLRRFQREFAADSITPDQPAACVHLADDALEDTVRFCHPAWLIEAMRGDWPLHYRTTLSAALERAPMTLRVNTAVTTRADEQETLTQAGIASSPLLQQALQLQQPRPVEQLPGFEQGRLTVQDAAAQFAAPLLLEAMAQYPQDAPRSWRVLDACAAPGGKTGHLLELDASLQVTALDNKALRLQRLTSTLQRLGLADRATTIEADAAVPESWWDGQLLDGILLDAPCTGTGVIRRHPDIKLLRQAQDLTVLQTQQQAMLDALWPLLRGGGVLLYATCSVLKAENARQMERFIKRHADAVEVPLERLATAAALPPFPPADASSAMSAEPPASTPLPGCDTVHARADVGHQILTGAEGMDGFYYCLLHKQARVPDGHHTQA